MRSFLLLVFTFLFYGCSNTSLIELSSDPNGAKIYDTKTNQYLGKTPLTLTYIYDNNPKTPKCEPLPPVTAIWGNNDAKITEQGLMVCQGQDYKMIIDQIAFSKPDMYRLVNKEKEWRFRPYFGVDLHNSAIDFYISDTQTSVEGNSGAYMYKLGFISDKDNRLEINYITYDFKDNDLSLYSLDTIIPLFKEQVKPYFKFGLGYYSYEYASNEYSNINYKIGFGVLGDISKDIEIDIGVSNKRGLNYTSLAEGVGFNGFDSLDSKIDLKSIVMGVNYKF